MTQNNSTVAYNVITINRNKEVVRTTTASSWKEALDQVEAKREAALTENWKVFEQGTFNYPHYVVRKNPSKFGGTFTTSFSMINGSKAEGGEYYFTYIKKAA